RPRIERAHGTAWAALALHHRHGMVVRLGGRERTRARRWELGMGYAAILVHVDADADSDPRVRLARELAARCKATLIGAGAWAMQSAGGGGGGRRGGRRRGAGGAARRGGARAGRTRGRLPPRP